MSNRPGRSWDLDELWRFAQLFHSSRMFQKMSVEQLFVVIEYGAELGLGPFQSTQACSIIAGKPGLTTEAMKALCHASGKVKKLEHELSGEGDTRRATVVAERKDSDTKISVSFSIGDAKRAGLPGRNPNWKSYPDRMLCARAYGFACRDAFPDAVFGYTTEELADMPEESAAREQDRAAEVLGIKKKEAEAEADCDHDQGVDLRVRVMEKLKAWAAESEIGIREAGRVARKFLALPLTGKLVDRQLAVMENWIDFNVGKGIDFITATSKED